MDDALRAIESPPFHELSFRQVAFVVHESSINSLLDAIVSVQFEVTVMKMELKFRLSRMKVVLSPSMFQFISQVELVNALSILPSFAPRTCYGTAELKLEKDRFVLAVSEFKVEITEIFGRCNVASYIPTFPLDGLINFGHPVELCKGCETERLVVKAKNPKVIVEQELVRLLVEVDYTPVASNN